MFVGLWDMRPEADLAALADLWQQIADLLDVHARAEETILYPVLLKQGGDGAPDETLDAIGDHNEIRDAIREASRLEPGSAPWWDAVLTCRKANDEHLAEEERDVIPDFREHSDPSLRQSLGRAWVRFADEHAGARGISDRDVDPQAYVEENS